MKSSRIMALSLSVLMMGTLAGSAFAGPFGKTVNGRQSQQSQRICNGIHNGALTKQEAIRLQKSQQEIRRYEKFARADGHISPQEARRLDNMLDRQNRAIYVQAHDGRYRG